MERLSFLPFQKRIWALIRSAPGPGRHAARNSIHGLVRAWKLREIDPAMAVFRTLTAEEESATAIFRALEFRQYPAARRLNSQKHPHKTAVDPFLNCLEHGLSTAEFMRLEPRLVVKSQAEGGAIRLQLKFQGPDGEYYALEPEPPLGGEFYIENVRYDFKAERELLLSNANERSMEKYLKERANQRNRILYATPKGIPVISDIKDWYFEKQRDIIFRNLTVFLLINQEPSHQLFVQQALDAFLEMLGRLAHGASDGATAT